MAPWLFAIALVGPDAPFAPVGDWSVSSTEHGCALSRSYSDGKSAMLLGFRPLTGAKSVKLVLLTDDIAKKRFGGGYARVAPGPEVGKAGIYSYFTRVEPGIDKRLVVIRA